MSTESSSWDKSIEPIEAIVPRENIPDKLLRTCLDKSIDERQGFGWGVMSRGIEEFNREFQPILPMSITEILSERCQKGEPSAVLDVMGFGAILYQLRDKGIPFSHGFSLSLGHWANTWYHQLDQKRAQEKIIFHLTGNILDQKLWETLFTEMKEKQTGKFGLVIWAPAGGFHPDFITNSLSIYNQLLQNVWSIISVTNGKILAEIPPWVTTNHNQEFHTWLELLTKSDTGIKRHPFCRFLKYPRSNGGVMVLDKTPLRKNLPLI